MATYFNIPAWEIPWTEEPGGGGGIVAKLCPTLFDPMDSSPPSSSVHGILQARVLEWVAIPFSRGASQSRD